MARERSDSPGPSDLPSGRVSSHPAMQPAATQAAQATAPTGQQQQVVVTGFVPQAAAAEPQAKDVTVPGGRYIVGGRFDPDQKKHFGGQVVDAHGNVLATFDDDAENTGNPDDGTKP